jgi:DNA-binding MarR family transcriptional regulator
MASNAALSAEVWRLLFDLVMWTRPARDRALERRGLTPNDARGLASLDAKVGKPMRQLAAEWGCDASNATWVVDRLERLRLAERHAVPHDRRMKLVALTAHGVKTKAELLEEFHTPPDELSSLNREELLAIRAALAKLHSHR